MASISAIKLPSGNTYDIKDSSSGYITGMTILSYGSSTWNDFIEAYNANKVVYCRASSNANPASGSQTRLAFMAYVNNATTPTNVEFQYYRSVSSHTASQQGDQVFVYKLDKTSGWSVTTREASVKVVAGTGLGGTYSNGTMTLTGPTKVSDLTNDSGFITSYTETDPVFSASAAAGITSSDISNWDNKSDFSGSYNDLTNKTSITTKTSDLNNDSGFITSYTDEKVSQSASTSNTPQPLLFRNNVSTGASSSTEAVRYSTTVTVTPNTGNITATKFNNYTLAEACEKVVDTSISANSSSANLPTSAAVASFVEGKGYITSYTETDPVFTASAAAGITSSDITNWNNKISDDKTWNGVELAKQSATNTGDSTYVPLATSTSPINMSFTPVKKTPTANAIAKYDASAYLYSTTPSASDNSTKVATTAYVDSAIVGASSDFIGTDGTAAGTHGLVPAPAATDSDKFLSSDGTWAEPPGSGSTISYVTKTENTYTTTSSSSISTIPIGIQSYASTDVLLVDINGLDLIQGTDYTISGTNIVLTTPITTSGTKVHFTALKMTTATTSDYATLKGEKGDDGHSPVVTASKSGTTTTVYVDGSSIASINDGTNGTHTISYTPIVTGGAQIGTITIDNTSYPLYAPAVVWG